MFIGRDGGVVPVHDHYALQIVFGTVPGATGLRTSESAPWTYYDAAIVPSRQPHSLDARALPYNAVIFVEPETPEGRALTELYLHDGIAGVSEAAIGAARDALFAAWLEQRDVAAVTRAAWGVIRTLTRGVEPNAIWIA